MENQLKDFPKEVIEKMLDRQEKQGKIRDITVLQKNPSNAFIWDETIEGHVFWKEVIVNHRFDVFFDKYPKADVSSEIKLDDLKDFPEEVILRMLDCQEEQGNPRNVKVFQERADAGVRIKGFNWDSTKEGRAFWHSVIMCKQFDLFFKRYPKSETVTERNDIEDFPEEIIEKMLDYQEKQGNPRDITVFQRNLIADCDAKGFDWNLTVERTNFWRDVIVRKNFDTFFERYPKPGTTPSISDPVTSFNVDMDLIIPHMYYEETEEDIIVNQPSVKHVSPRAFHYVDNEIIDLRNTSIEYLNLTSFYECECNDLYLPSSLKVLDLTEYDNHLKVDIIYIDSNTIIIDGGKEIGHNWREVSFVSYDTLVTTEVKQVERSTKLITKRRR